MRAHAFSITPKPICLFLTLLAAVALAVCCGLSQPVTAYADDAETDELVYTASAAAMAEADFSYTVKDGDFGHGAYVYGYKDSNYGNNAASVPKTLGGAPVVSVLFNQISGLQILDVSKCTSLKQLVFYYTGVASIDLSKNTALQELNCSRTKLTKLDLSKNTALTRLSCEFSPLASLNLSKQAKLKYLRADGCKLSSLVLPSGKALTYVRCDENQLTSLNVSGCTGLTDLFCESNKIASLDVSKNRALEYLHCGHNKLTSLNVSNNASLIELRCYNNAITALDVSRLPKLDYLVCSDNKISSLDISKNPALRYLSCNRNNISRTAELEAWLAKAGHSGYVLPQNVPIDNSGSSGNTGGSGSKGSYADVPTSHWAFDNIEQARVLGFMTGDGSGNTFRPDSGITRAEVVTALWKAAGQPSAKKQASFTDLSAGWYKTSIAWAEENKVTTGYTDGSGRFGPDDPVTREQFATLIARYAKSLGKNVEASNTAAFEKMPDKGTVSGFALPSIRWAMEQKIITGKNGSIDPRSGATRAEVATMMVRAKGFIG